jgi:hypothetical protein
VAYTERVITAAALIMTISFWWAPKPLARLHDRLGLDDAESRPLLSSP